MRVALVPIMMGLSLVLASCSYQIDDRPGMSSSDIIKILGKPYTVLTYTDGSVVFQYKNIEFKKVLLDAETDATENTTAYASFEFDKRDTCTLDTMGESVSANLSVENGEVFRNGKQVDQSSKEYNDMMKAQHSMTIGPSGTIVLPNADINPEDEQRADRLLAKLEKLFYCHPSPPYDSGLQAIPPTDSK